MNKDFEKINENDPSLKKELDHIEINLSVQSLEEAYSGIEDISEIDDKVMKYLERQIRNSYEYKEYIKYLKTELDISKCSLTPGLDLHDINFQLEFHHYPFSLYDIVSVITSYMIDKKAENEKLSLFDIMEAVMKEHYNGNIGLVPLSSTTHEMFHNGAVKIPFSAIYGNYDAFLLKYKNYINPELSEKVIDAKTITEDDAKKFNEKLNKNILDYNIAYNQ